MRLWLPLFCYGPDEYKMGPLPFYKEGEAPKPGKARMRL